MCHALSGVSFNRRIRQVAWLEFELQGELHLSRRTGVAGREASIDDLTKGRAAHHTSRLPKVRMIEEIEAFPTEFDRFVLADLRPLNYREVNILESGPDDDVAAQVAEAAHRYNERRSVEPGGNRSDVCDRTIYIRAHRVVVSGERRVVDHDRDGISALQCNDWRNLPAVNQLVFVKWKFVQAAHCKAMTSIKVRQSTVGLFVVAILQNDALRVE